MSTVSITPTLAKDLQDAVVGWLKVRREFAGIAIIGRRKGNIVNDIDTAVAQLGACLLVLPGLPVEMNSEVPGPYVDKYRLTVRVIENPVLNTKLPDAYELVELVLRALHQMQFPKIIGMNPLYCAQNPVEFTEDPERTVADVVFFTSCGLKPRTN